MPGSHGFNPSPAETRTLQSAACGYRTFDSWSLSNVWSDLSIVLPEECDYMPTEARWRIFNGFTWTRITSEHWHIPLVATALYLLMIPLVKRIMADRKPLYLQSIVVTWNFALSIFSMAGVAYCVPQLLFGRDVGLFTGGFYPSVCTHASSYGMGESGFFVALFIYSKLAELFDTLWLLLRKSPVILLHWYHHATVLLYCWHAYSVRIGTGLWFAAMNYSVHALMYFYFGVTQTGPKGRKLAKKFSMMITSLQLLQMVVGIYVTISSVLYHAQGKTCYVSLTNSFLGLVMYSSYFVLFLQLFLSHYVFNKKDAKLPAPARDHGAADALNQAADAAAKAKPADSGRPKKAD